MFEKLKKQYDEGYTTKDTLKIWVRINSLKRGRGITQVEYKEITGETYKA